MEIDSILKEKYNLVLPRVPTPGGKYTPVVQTGNLVYISGQTCTKDGVSVLKGVVGEDITIEQGQEAARLAVLNCLALLKDYIKDFAKVKRVVQMIGYVRSAKDFGEQPKVIDGASQLLLDVFGDRGKHSRLALGINELPGRAPVELFMIVEV